MRLTDRPKALWLSLLPVVASLALAGCGGEESPPTEVTSRPPAQTEQPSDPNRVPKPVLTPTPTPEPSPTPSPTPTPTAATCPAGVTLPAGIDPRACGPIPSGATPITALPDAWGSLMFRTPSWNIACATEYESFGCMIYEYSYVDPPALRVPCAGDPGDLCGSNGFRIDRGLVQLMDRSDVPPWSATCWDLGTCGTNYIDTRLPELRYGQVAVLERYACISAEEGLTCWDTVVGHGFFLSRDSYATW